MRRDERSLWSKSIQKIRQSLGEFFQPKVQLKGLFDRNETHGPICPKMERVGQHILEIRWSFFFRNRCIRNQPWTAPWEVMIEIPLNRGKPSETHGNQHSTLKYSINGVIVTVTFEETSSLNQQLDVSFSWQKPSLDQNRSEYLSNKRAQRQRKYS